MELINKNVYLVKNESMFPSNTFIYTNDNGESIIIDPGFDKDKIEIGLQNQNMKPLAILCTHGHFDHIASVKYFKDKFKIPFYLHASDLKILKSANFFLKLAHIDNQIDIAYPDFLFHGELENHIISTIKIDVYHLPGHSQGSCVFAINKLLFTGDMIYKNGLGLGSIPKENTTQLKQSILKLFEIFKDDHIFFPGHGSIFSMHEIKNCNAQLNNFLK